MNATGCWVDGAPRSPYDVTNLPYGVFTRGSDEPRVGARIGDFVLDLAPLAASQMMARAEVFESPTLNPFMRLGHDAWGSVRRWLTEGLTDPDYRDEIEPFLVPLADVTLRLPLDVADYVDFYCSIEHATNVGRILRPDAEPLLPNWRHLPVGYHGRAGTIVVSGTSVVRPCGQRKSRDEPAPDYGPTRRLDIEAELGFVVGVGSRLGDRVSTAAFREHVFGVVLLNDWSARDIQAWEYVPLGPFLGKSFATTISPWVVPLDALAAATVPLPGQQPEPLPYLQVQEPAGLDIEYEVRLNQTLVSRPPYRTMYWSAQQMLAHLTVNGASLRTGDLFASGTVSGAQPSEQGSLLELSWGGSRPVSLDDGSTRTFLEDGDEVTMTATAPGPRGTTIGLGEVSGEILPARR